MQPATDDWPFLYLNPRGRPVAYVLVLALYGLSWLALLFRGWRLRWATE